MSAAIVITDAQIGAWENEAGEVISAATKLSMENNQGTPGRTMAATYSKPLYLAASGGAVAPQAPAPLDVDALAQEIRRVDGNHTMGSGALAEALMPFLAAALAQPGSGT